MSFGEEGGNLFKERAILTGERGLLVAIDVDLPDHP
jgi:hypothetical protein